MEHPVTSWDERYKEPGYAFGVAPNDFLIEAAAYLPKFGKILSLGEGEGRNAVYLAEKGWDVTGIDASLIGLQKAKALASERGVFINTAFVDLEDFPIDDFEWDGIVSIFCHLAPCLRKRVCLSSVKSLRPGGAIIIEAFHAKQAELKTGGPSNPELLLTLETLQNELPGLDFPVAREVEREIHEGRFHKGMCRTVQVVGVKKGQSLTP